MHTERKLDTAGLTFIGSRTLLDCKHSRALRKYAQGPTAFANEFMLELYNCLVIIHLELMR